MTNPTRPVAPPMPVTPPMIGLGLGLYKGPTAGISQTLCGNPEPRVRVRPPSCLTPGLPSSAGIPRYIPPGYRSQGPSHLAYPRPHPTYPRIDPEIASCRAPCTVTLFLPSTTPMLPSFEGTLGVGRLSQKSVPLPHAAYPRPRLTYPRANLSMLIHV